MRRFSGLAILSLAVGVAAAAPNQPGLKDAFHDSFRIGAALNSSQFAEEDVRGAALIKQQFNSITQENVLSGSAFIPSPAFTISICRTAMSRSARRITC